MHLATKLLVAAILVSILLGKLSFSVIIFKKENLLHLNTLTTHSAVAKNRWDNVTNISYTVGDNPRALGSWLSYVQVDKHCITILYHLHYYTDYEICNIYTMGFPPSRGLP